MDNFISDSAKNVWNLFEKTGNVGVYMLYFSLQHTKESTLDKIINEDLDKKEGMEL